MWCWSSIAHSGDPSVASILAVSADDLTAAEGAAHQWDAPFPILSDSGRDAITDYGVLTDRNIARPSTFIIDKEGVIRWKYVGSTGDRPDSGTVLEQLKAIEG